PEQARGSWWTGEPTSGRSAASCTSVQHPHRWRQTKYRSADPPVRPTPASHANRQSSLPGPPFPCEDALLLRIIAKAPFTLLTTEEPRYANPNDGRDDHDS